jgi:hypothetical protein
MVVRRSGIQDETRLDDSERIPKKTIVLRNLFDSIRTDRKFARQIMVHTSNLRSEMFFISCLSGGARSIRNSG